MNREQNSWVEKLKETVENGEEVALRYLREYTNIFRHHRDAHTARVLSRVWKIASTSNRVGQLVRSHGERLGSLYSVLAIEEGLDNIQEHLQEAIDDFRENPSAELEEFRPRAPVNRCDIRQWRRENKETLKDYHRRASACLEGIEVPLEDLRRLVCAFE
jgi:HD superfamily phosphohydrolase